LRPYQENGYQIFELGKYYIDPSLSPLEYHRVRNELFQWLLQNYFNPERQLSSKVLFVIDVGSLSHERAYRSLFGAQRVPLNQFTPPLPEGESVLIVEYQVLKDRLEKILLSEKKSSQ
jgi:hypothetical protein